MIGKQDGCNKEDLQCIEEELQVGGTGICRDRSRSAARNRSTSRSSSKVVFLACSISLKSPVSRFDFTSISCKTGATPTGKSRTSCDWSFVFHLRSGFPSHKLWERSFHLSQLLNGFGCHLLIASQLTCGVLRIYCITNLSQRAIQLRDRVQRLCS